LTWQQAALEAAALRFRPILMTSLATILGALPIAFSLGAASESRVGMGVVVVGGMFLATFLTLYIIPSLYVVFSRLKRKHVIGAMLMVLTLGATSMNAQPLTLDDAISIALAKSFDVRVVRQDSLSARTAGASAISGFLPTLNVNATYADGSNNLNQTLASGSEISRDGAGYSNLAANVVLSWTIFDGLEMFATRDRLSALEQEGLARVQSRMTFIVADVITAYSAMVATKRFLVIADSAFRLAQQRYSIESNRFEGGSISGVEVAQAEIDRNNANSIVVRLSINYDNARATLNTLLGRDAATPFMVSDSVRMPPIPMLSELKASIDATNPDVMASRFALASASAHVSEVSATFYPKVAILGAYQVTRNTSQAGFLLENRSNGAYVGATFQWNIFNGLRDQYDRDQARIDEERARLNIEALRNDLHGQAERVLRSYRGIEELLAIQKQTLTAAEKNARVALEKLRIGTITPLEVRQSLLSLLEAGESAARLEYEQRLAATEALRLQGMLVR
ncbi:MAG: TolC family protein, partial [Candidatus Kapabacteria bacterium]|nr:TolC family protein [Candidatus Kapabacteria bacterium]